MEYLERFWQFYKKLLVRFDLGFVWQMWKRLGEIMGNFLARVVVSIFYFTILAPFGIGMRLFGDPLAIKHPPQSGWQERHSTENLTIEEEFKKARNSH